MGCGSSSSGVTASDSLEPRVVGAQPPPEPAGLPPVAMLGEEDGEEQAEEDAAMLAMFGLSTSLVTPPGPSFDTPPEPPPVELPPGLSGTVVDSVRGVVTKQRFRRYSSARVA